jgi:transposase
MSLRQALRGPMKTIVRKDTGDDYATYLKKLCEAEGNENPTVEDARRMDRTRKSKKTSNKDWESPTDGDARIVRLKEGRTHLGYKAEHVVDRGAPDGGVGSVVPANVTNIRL